MWWRLYFGEVAGDRFVDPKEAIFALANRTARLPAGETFERWRAPTELASWKHDQVEDLPPRPEDPNFDEYE